VLIYFAGPLFSEAERVFNVRLTERLEQANFEVFLPQRDGVKRDKPPYERMSADERRRAMFELDQRKIFECDIFLFVLDGRVPDEGACVELGLAHAHKELRGTRKLLVGLHTDARAAFLSSKLNPMLYVPLERVAEAEEELLKIVEDYRSTLLARQTSENSPSQHSGE
jgi:nucleoside 2-deoxyribosyltransferase